MMRIWRLSDVCLSVAYIGPKSRTERPRKNKIGTKVAHVTRDLDTTFKIKGQRSTCRGRAYCDGLPHSLFDHQCLRWVIHFFRNRTAGVAGTCCSSKLHQNNTETRFTGQMPFLTSKKHRNLIWKLSGILRNI